MLVLHLATLVSAALAPVDAPEAQVTPPAPTEANATPAVPSPPPEATPAKPAPVATHDPFEQINRASYAVTQPIDRFVMRPVAIGYKTLMPKPGRDGIRNFLANLFEPVVFVNDLIQLRPKRVLHTTGRFLLNSTLGIGGLFDVAKRKPFHLAAHANGFADTLGYYGMHAGPYFYLPVVGPASLRDIAGFAADWFTQPRLLGKMANPDNEKSFFHSSIKMGSTSIGIVVAGGIGQRADNDEALETLKAQSVDPYAALRSSWLQDREAEIAALKARDGAPADVPAFTDPLEDPAAAKTAAPPASASAP